MADAIVGSMADAIVGSLVESLISLLKTEFSEIKGVKKDVKKLENTLSAIQAVLEDAEEEQIKNKSITDWLRKLKDSTYDAEDALDAWSLEIQQRELDFANMGCSSKILGEEEKKKNSWRGMQPQQCFSLIDGFITTVNV